MSDNWTHSWLISIYFLIAAGLYVMGKGLEDINKTLTHHHESVCHIELVKGE